MKFFNRDGMDMYLPAKSTRETFVLFLLMVTFIKKILFLLMKRSLYICFHIIAPKLPYKVSSAIWQKFFCYLAVSFLA